MLTTENPDSGLRVVTSRGLGGLHNVSENAGNHMTKLYHKAKTKKAKS
jgi:hypothetical protein